MVWKLREGKVPSKQWMADLLAYLEQSHGIAPTREVVEKLYAIIVEQWREGATVREVGKATCSCQKGQIVPSPAALVQLKRGELKPPRSAKRGDLFGFEELRARKIREKADADKVKTTSAQPKRSLSALPLRPARLALPASSAVPERSAPLARKPRTLKKGPLVKTQTSPAPSAAPLPARAAEPTTVAPAPLVASLPVRAVASAPQPKPDPARLKATEAKLRNLAQDLEGDDL